MSTAPPSFIQEFLSQFPSRRAHRLSPYLDDRVTYEVVGLPVVEGRLAVLKLWERKFQAYAEVSMMLRRQACDGDVVLTQQRQVFAARNRPPVIVDSLVVYEIYDGRIVTWRSHLDLDDVHAEEVERWRRLRAARW